MLSRANVPVLHFDDLLGHPLAGGKLYTYVSGEDKAIATYKDSEGTLNTNPVVLNARGEAEVWLDPAVTYRFVVKNLIGATIIDKSGITADVMTYSAAGSDTITVETTTVDGKTTSTFSVTDGSIDKSKLKGTRDLIPDTQYISMERQEGSGEVILSLAAEVPDNDNDYTLKMNQGVMEWDEDYAAEAGHATSADTATSAESADVAAKALNVVPYIIPMVYGGTKTLTFGGYLFTFSFVTSSFGTATFGSALEISINYQGDSRNVSTNYQCWFPSLVDADGRMRDTEVTQTSSPTSTSTSLYIGGTVGSTDVFQVALRHIFFGSFDIKYGTEVIHGEISHKNAAEEISLLLTKNY